MPGDEKWESRETNGLNVFSSGRSPRHVGQLDGLWTTLFEIRNVLFSWLGGGSGELPGRHGPGRGNKVDDAIHLASAGDGHHLLTLSLRTEQAPPSQNDQRQTPKDFPAFQQPHNSEVPILFS